jgi:hypothetical protein
MNDIPRELAEASRPDVSPLQAISNCLDQLFDDHKRSSSDFVVEGLTFEELIGALLLAKDLAEDEEAQQAAAHRPG